ncbi:serine hydrolase domain-containing protein [Longimicrobium sp.]|uniref:serine hydrolase domain-containing protein n=1 Tax=Longimicrobium sp. TaxID=2029185 RepID=UPI002E32332A|nr:serine hydrolase domain-containing protein [Longimicrobium sp.]HEX6042690.1 serine hydrolase domain-containing protein [Longimicrobium sp.]
MRAFEAEVDSLRVAHGIPGLSIAIVRDGRVVLARGFGFADVEARVRATEHTPYPIASVTKPVSAVVAMRLVERGVLDLDRPMSTYANWAEFCTEARDEGPPIFFRDYDCSPNVTLRHVLSMRMNGTAGERFYYNPISYSWASRPMMQVTGRAFSDLTAEEVFAPAGMTESARTHRNLPLRADLAAAIAPPYHVDSAGAFVRSPPLEAQGDGAAGGVISTVADLAKFDIALDEGRLISDASKTEMWRPGRSSAGAVLPYGIGWYVEEVDGRRAVWHTGWWEQAYSALYLKLPDERLTLILLANSEGLWWNKPLDAARVDGSPFAASFLRHFPRR